MSQLGLFDIDNRLQALSDLKDPLEILQNRIPWEVFRKDLKRALHKEKKNKAGRKPFDGLLMFKILILQSLYGLSDHQMEFQIKDRLSFMRFLGFGAEARIPDEKTIWLYRETLAKGGYIKPLFDRFDAHLQKAGYRAQKGMIVDATIVEVPRSRNTPEENKQIKNGETPETLSENPNVLRQKDLDARWTKKRGETFYGYKDHVSVELENLLDPWNTKSVVYGDSAYKSEEKEEKLGELGYWFRFNQKGYRGSPLTDGQKRRNRRNSRIRARVEHVFGWMERKTGGILTRCVGQIRAAAKIGLKNLVYNLSRFAYLEGAT